MVLLKLDDDLYESLGKMTEEMYMGLAKAQAVKKQEQLVRYHGVTEAKIYELKKSYGECIKGEVIKKQEENLEILFDDYKCMKNDINSKYKVYLRGCGNSGKSTLLNALLSLDESVGSRIGRLPMTFIIDVYTDELDINEAEVRKVGVQGEWGYKKVSRNEAIAMEEKEEKEFKESKEKCQKIISEKKKMYFLKKKSKILRRKYLKRI